MRQWESNMSVGNDALDDDHKAFFALSSQLHEASDPIVIESIQNYIDDYNNNAPRNNRSTGSESGRMVDGTHLESHAQYIDWIKGVDIDSRALCMLIESHDEDADQFAV